MRGLHIPSIRSFGSTRGERVVLMKGKAKLDSRLRGNDESEVAGCSTRSFTVLRMTTEQSSALDAEPPSKIAQGLPRLRLHPRPHEQGIGNAQVQRLDLIAQGTR